MHTKNLFPILALVLTGSLTTAGSVAQKAQEPTGQVKPAAATKLEPGPAIKFGVTGLTKENLQKVQLSLTELTTPVYVCEGCKHEETKAGKCTPCNLDLKAKKEAVLIEAAPSVETASIRLVPASVRTLRYSELEAALKKNSIEIDHAMFPLAGKSSLVLRGGTLENAEVIEKALVDSKLFSSVDATFDAPSGEIRVAVQANATPPMHDKVSSVIDELGTKAKLTDVIWGPPAPATKA